MKKKTPPPEDHTKAILVGLAYLIGFTTAYIAFELNTVYPTYSEKYDTVSESAVVQKASVYSAVKAVVTEEGLFVENGEGERIISAKTDSEELEFGFHREVVASSVSPDGTMVHYCATMDESDSCYHFVYVVSEDMVHPVKEGEELLITSSAVARTSVWLPNNTMDIGGALSVSSASPWVLQ